MVQDVIIPPIGCLAGVDDLSLGCNTDADLTPFPSPYYLLLAPSIKDPRLINKYPHIVGIPRIEVGDLKFAIH